MPVSIIARAFTTDNDTEIKNCLKMLQENTGGTNFIHESFLVDVKNGSNYTKNLFPAGNSYFSELIIYLLDKKPYLLK
jgi:meiotically up-regulated gene 157 (Mug157) protein